MNELTGSERVTEAGCLRPEPEPQLQARTQAPAEGRTRSPKKWDAFAEGQLVGRDFLGGEIRAMTRR